MNTHAVVLAAHGSDRDRDANATVRRHAEGVRARRLFAEVAAGFHQGDPGLDRVLDELGADAVTVVPFFTSAGHYSEVVLPKALARNRRYPKLRVRIAPPLGTHPGVAPLVARRVGELLRAEQLDRADLSLVVVGHGTKRHGASRQATLDLVATLARRRVAPEVLAAFIDDDPPLDGILSRTAHGTVVVVPFLIGGAHASGDLPAALGIEVASPAPLRGQRDGRTVLVDVPIGSYEGLVDLVIDLARRNPPPPPERFKRRGGRPPRAALPGTVHIVGAGPGDPGLITRRGLDLLRSADVIVHDRLAAPELLSETRPGAELVDVGKRPGHAPVSQEEIQRLLVAHARRGRTVVRLKGGDPFVFGRGSEEVAACRAAGIPCTVVPGISSAIAGPAAAGIPVTARGLSRGFAVLTARDADGQVPSELDAVVEADTLIVLMGRSSLDELSRRLIAAGRDPDTPAACIQSATTPQQRVTVARLATLAAAADRDGLEAPVVTVIGAVAALADIAAVAGAAPLAAATA